MIIKYSEGKIDTTVSPTEDDKDKFEKKTKEALNEGNDIVKEASNEKTKPFWLNK